MSDSARRGVDEPSAPVPVGIDDGFAATKIALPDGRLVVIPSRGRIGKLGATQIAGVSTEIDAAEYVTEETIYTVGHVDGVPTRFDGYASSALNRVIVQHALQTAGLAGRTIHAVSGLPMRGFYHPDGSRRETAIDAKRTNLQKPVLGCSDTRPAEIAFHAVIPEALAAWYDMVIDDSDGDPQLNEARVGQPVGIVDIGGRTTDYAVVADQALQHGMSGSVEWGLLDVRAEVAER